MRPSIKPILLSCMLLVTGLFAIAYVSCNKDNSATATVVKKCVTCVNGGLCIKDTCRCPGAYEGFSCETLAGYKFSGSWMVREDGSTSGPSTYFASVNYIGSAGSPGDLYVNYLHSDIYNVRAQVAHDSFIISRQTIDNKTVEGVAVVRSKSTNGSSQSTTIAIRYKVTDNTTMITDDFGYTSLADSPSVWTRN